MGAFYFYNSFEKGDRGQQEPIVLFLQVLSDTLGPRSSVEVLRVSAEQRE